MRRINNAVLVPLYEAKNLIVVQDRRGHKPPPWGFFGGGIEAGETPLQAITREVKEELSLELSASECEFQGKVTGQFGDLHFHINVFTWRFDGNLNVFSVNEGAGMELITPDEMLKRVQPHGPDYKITHLISKLVDSE